MAVADHLPLEQGLRLRDRFLDAASIARRRPSAIRTRIKTCRFFEHRMLLP